MYSKHKPTLVVRLKDSEPLEPACAATPPMAQQAEKGAASEPVPSSAVAESAVTSRAAPSRSASQLTVSIENSTSGVWERVETGVWAERVRRRAFWRAYRDTCSSALEVSIVPESDT